MLTLLMPALPTLNLLMLTLPMFKQPMYVSWGLSAPALFVSVSQLSVRPTLLRFSLEPCRYPRAVDALYVCGQLATAQTAEVGLFRAARRRRRFCIDRSTVRRQRRFCID